MKKKIILSALVILFVVAASLGATMAWFTDSADPLAGTFQAGTVAVKDGSVANITGGNKDIVNPGDCFVLCWDFENEGTKRIELRTELTPLWVEDQSLSVDNVFILPQYASDWVLYEESGKLWAYYLGGPVEAGQTVSLCLVVYFDGELTTNLYQGKAFEVQATVEAVQASNNAPSEVWGTTWNAVNAPGYSFDYTAKYGESFDLEKIDCYKGGGNGGTVRYGEHYVGIEDRLSLDFDYNDFGMTFNLTETYDEENKLLSLNMVFNSVSYLAGDNHDIKIDHLGLAGVGYAYTITRSAVATGNETLAGDYNSSDKPLDQVVLYDTLKYTNQTVKMNDEVTVNIQLDNPTQLASTSNPRPGLAVVDLEEGLWYYNFILVNKTTPNTFNMTTTTPNATNTMEVKAPFIIVVPKPGFVPPKDAARIDTAYSGFKDYYIGGTQSDWFNNPTDLTKLAW